MLTETQRQEIGRRITEKRKLKKDERGKAMSQGRLAAAIDVTEKSIQNYEAGKRDVPLSKLTRIADAIDTSVDYLLYGEREEGARSRNPERTLKEFDALYLDGILTEEQIQDRLYRLRKMRQKKGLM